MPADLEATERERMIAELERVVAEQSALRRVATLVASGARTAAVVDAVSAEAALVVGAEAAAVTRFEDEDGRAHARVVGEWAAPTAPALGKDAAIPLDGDGTLSRIFQGAESARIDDYDALVGGATSVARTQGFVSTAAAPIAVAGRPWGALIVATTRHTPLPDDAETRLGEFARLCSLAVATADSLEQLAHAAALERSRSAQLQRLLAEQAALRRIATLVAGDVPPDAIFAAVSEGAARVAGGESGAVARYDGVTATIVGRWDDAGSRGMTLSDGEAGVVDAVRHDGAPARRDDDGAPDGIRSIVAAPVFVAGRTWGALAVGTTSAALLPLGTEERLVRFANLIAIAVSSAQAWEELLDSRARVVQASEEERRRLGRNLHDGAQQRLAAVLTLLRIAEGRLEPDPAAAREALARAIDEIATANSDLRELARGLHPVALSERGIEAALRSLTRSATVAVELQVTGERLPEPVESAMYYVAAEALANATRYAAAAGIRISIRQTETDALLEVADDGAGGADPFKGSGLRGLTDRVEALRGQLEIDSAPQRGTTIRARFPLPL
jgi:signal transduction histidine kinase